MARGGLGFPIHMSLKILNGTDALDVCLSHAWERPPVTPMRARHDGGRGSKTKSFHTHFLLSWCEYIRERANPYFALLRQRSEQ